MDNSQNGIMEKKTEKDWGHYQELFGLEVGSSKRKRFIFILQGMIPKIIKNYNSNRILIIHT